MTISELQTKKLLFSYVVNDDDREMAGVKYSFYMDEENGKVYAHGEHIDAVAPIGNFAAIEPKEVTKEIALSKAKEYCKDELEQIYERFLSGKYEWSDLFESIYNLLQCEDISFDKRLAVMKSIRSYTSGDLESYDLWLYDNLNDSNAANQARTYKALRELHEHAIWKDGLAKTRLFCYLNLSVTEYTKLCLDLGWKDSDRIIMYKRLAKSDNVLCSEGIPIERYMEGRGRAGTDLYIHYDVDHNKKYFEGCEFCYAQHAPGELYFITLRDELSYEDAVAPYENSHVNIDKITYENIVQKYTNLEGFRIYIEEQEERNRQYLAEQEKKDKIKKERERIKQEEELKIKEERERQRKEKERRDREEQQKDERIRIKLEEIKRNQQVIEKEPVEIEKEDTDSKPTVERINTKEAVLSKPLIYLIRSASFLFMIVGGFCSFNGIIAAVASGITHTPLPFEYYVVLVFAIVMFILGLTAWKKAGEKMKLLNK